MKQLMESWRRFVKLHEAVNPATIKKIQDAISQAGGESYITGGAVRDGLMPDVPEYPSFEEDITVFPGEFVDAIEMVNQVASDVGLDDMVIDITVIGDDKDLTAAAGQLKALASSREFKQMLKQMPGKTDLAAPVEEAPPAGPADEEMDNMMMMRM